MLAASSFLLTWSDLYFLGGESETSLELPTTPLTILYIRFRLVCSGTMDFFLEEVRAKLVSAGEFAARAWILSRTEGSSAWAGGRRTEDMLSIDGRRWFSRSILYRCLRKLAISPSQSVSQSVSHGRRGRWTFEGITEPTTETVDTQKLEARILFLDRANPSLTH